MAREFHTDVDLKGQLQLAGSSGAQGQSPFSRGSTALPTWDYPTIGQTKQVIAESISIASGHNAISVDFVEIAANCTVTIPQGSIWRIVKA